jgi:hypothetical protein
MTLKDVETSNHTNITIELASEIMNVNPQFLRLSLQQQRFPFGTATKGKRWVYYINKERFIQYMNGTL